MAKDHRAKGSGVLQLTAVLPPSIIRSWTFSPCVCSWQIIARDENIPNVLTLKIPEFSRTWLCGGFEVTCFTFHWEFLLCTQDSLLTLISHLPRLNVDGFLEQPSAYFNRLEEEHVRNIWNCLSPGSMNTTLVEFICNMISFIQGPIPHTAQQTVGSISSTNFGLRIASIALFVASWQAGPANEAQSPALKEAPELAEFMP
ncbi:hypothetical protein HCBG_05694 [Histoplasma capsulatum G186AR]|uniref:Uncharacterized protein n=1 Tax=Ajellomyces capsulatus (strain G186AR / H82 / ATCC MYA-2454 / RMSCC 2432) TaxID=447093 RepID=C0NQA6_AJECG|nr:uncharacterized protein HCBG_05694 [Histoplasma capsulatum G186AR]EEH06379.1 hypothetical protein HCBG_05694 [Histoplasma capsulatum G186AR]